MKFLYAHWDGRVSKDLGTYFFLTKAFYTTGSDCTTTNAIFTAHWHPALPGLHGRDRRRIRKHHS